MIHYSGVSASIQTLSLMGCLMADPYLVEPIKVGRYAVSGKLSLVQNSRPKR